MKIFSIAEDPCENWTDVFGVLMVTLRVRKIHFEIELHKSVFILLDVYNAKPSSKKKSITH